MRLLRVVVAALLLTLTVSVVNAYTLVMRDGRQVEIPDEFTVSGSTLTYEIGSGMQRTIQLSTIDISATERANGEPSGAFFKKGSTPKVIPQSRQRRSSANRSITNQDLEVYRRARVQSEIAYEKRRKDLGLPSAEQQRLEVSAITERTHQQLSGMKAREQDAEQYWRGRASDLRAEMGSVDAQVGYVRQRLDELPQDNSLNGFSTIVPYGPYGAYPYQNVWTSTITRTGSLSFRSGFNNGRRVFPGADPFSRFPRARGYNRFNTWPYGNVLALPYQGYDSSYERTELVGKLNELEMQRAGLRARWRDLEEEARRAGAYPGWLR